MADDRQDLVLRDYHLTPTRSKEHFQNNNRKERLASASDETTPHS